MKKSWSLLFSLGYCAVGNALIGNSATAQITTDETTNTTVSSDSNGNFTIEQGDRAGNNLFHSFGQFSVPSNGSAFFNNATDISNIFSRVTGGNVSNIDGLIRANGSANLFLINPAGIMFGENARLDIGGSFLGTTADSILFEDGEFSATDFDNPPLLTVNAPIGLNFRDNPTPINIARQPPGSANLDPAPFDDSLFGLRVPDGKTFALAGGDITADGGGIVVVGGRIEIGAVGGEGILGLNFEGDNISFNYPDDLARANVTLTNNAGFLVSGSGGGDIAITANNIEILEGSGLEAGIFSGLGSPDARAGDITLESSEAILVDGIIEDNNFSGVFNQVNQNSIGNAGRLNINTSNLSVTNGAQISTSTNGQGNGGDLFIDASGSVLVDGASNNENAFTGVFNQVNSSAVGNSGEIEINAGNLKVVNDARISTSILGEGNSGMLSIDAEQVFLSDSANNPFTSIRSNVGNDAMGNSEGISINASLISVNDGAQIQSFTNGIGNSGKITIDADLVEFSGRDTTDSPSGAFSLVESSGRGDAGGIDITANSLFLSDRAQLLSNTQGIGNAGGVNLQIVNETTLLSASILSEVSAATEMSAGGFGEGGDINITTGSLILKDGSSLLADTENQGNAGDINLNVNNNIILEGKGISAARNATNLVPSQISTTVESQAIGDGGSINISTSSLLVKENAFINATSFGQGKAGIIDVMAVDVQLEDEVEIIAETFLREGGNILLNIGDNLTLRDNSLISARAFNNANGGNLTIDANFIIAFPDGNNDIIANAQQGRGGRITINAESLLGIQERPLNDSTNDINASSQDSDLDGDVVINASDINPVQGTTELPSNIVEPDQTVAQACANNRGRGVASNFVVTGKGGIAPLPTAPLGSETITFNGEPAANSNSVGAIATSIGKITPARGAVKRADGRIILTAAPVTGSASRISNNLLNCG